MLTTQGSSLVAGAAANSMVKRFIKVQRAFYLEGRALAVGEVVEVPAGFAAEMIHASKAIACAAPVAVVEAVAVVPIVEADKPRRGRPPKEFGNDK